MFACKYGDEDEIDEIVVWCILFLCFLVLSKNTNVMWFYDVSELILLSQRHRFLVSTRDIPWGNLLAFHLSLIFFGCVWFFRIFFLWFWNLSRILLFGIWIILTGDNRKNVVRVFQCKACGFRFLAACFDAALKKGSKSLCVRSLFKIILWWSLILAYTSYYLACSF